MRCCSLWLCILCLGLLPTAVSAQSEGSYPPKPPASRPPVYIPREPVNCHPSRHTLSLWQSRLQTLQAKTQYEDYQRALQTQRREQRLAVAGVAVVKPPPQKPVQVASRGEAYQPQMSPLLRDKTQYEAYQLELQKQRRERRLYGG